MLLLLLAVPPWRGSTVSCGRWPKGGICCSQGAGGGGVRQSSVRQENISGSSSNSTTTAAAAGPTDGTFGNGGAGAEASPAPLLNGEGSGVYVPVDDRRVEKAVIIKNNAKASFYDVDQVLQEKITMQYYFEQGYHVALARLAGVFRERRIVLDVLEGPVKGLPVKLKKKREESSWEWDCTQ